MSSDKEPSFLVGITELPPFTEKKQQHATGFEVELWEKIAHHLGWSFRYRFMTLPALIQAVKKGTCVLGMAGISKSETRERVIDYTHTTYKSGLSILVRTEQKIRVLRSLRHVLRQSKEKVTGLIIALAVFIALASHVIWFIERGQGAFSEVYAKGISDVMWFVIVTISTVGYGDFTPVTAIGRMIAILLIVCGYAFFALVIAEINTLFVYAKSASAVYSADDLQDKKVATIKDTIVPQLLESYQAHLRPVKTIKEAIGLLERGEVDAFVFDAPVLQHYLKIHRPKQVRLVGGRFEEHDYAFIVPEKSPLLESINRVLLRMIETGEYDALYKKWFTA